MESIHSTLGQTFVLIALAAAGYGSVLGFFAGYTQSPKHRRLSEYAGYVFGLCMLGANGTMISALLRHDFSVAYVARVGSRATPVWVTLVSLWSSLEGSILFWGFILGLYVVGFIYSMRGRYREFMPYAIGTILAVCVFFAFLIAAPANPFGVVSPVPQDGPGPNPLLQNHILMIIHPPSLYFGYVGMTIPFGIAVAALLRGKLSTGWLKPLRVWTLIPWTFLSVGIILGGWWAYEVLGWGGYWAWDPVENASFLPWLAATGYLHSTVVQERKKILKVWTLSLVLASFLLTILGTFMTRSGVFNSVHSFTQSSIGPIFLGFLAIILIVSLGLLTGRAHLLEAEGRVESPLGREAVFMLNNAIFAIFTFTVLLGTVFPLLVEAIKGTKLSVGEPYFNAMAIPLGLTLLFLMGVGPVLPWGRPQLHMVLHRFIVPVGVGLAVVALCLFNGFREGLTLATFGLAGFAAVVQVRELIAPIRARALARGTSLLSSVLPAISAHRRRVGGYLVHLSMIAIIVAIAASQTYRLSVEASMKPGESFVIGAYTLTYVATEADDQPHRFSVFANIKVTRAGVDLGTMQPRLNFYPTQREPVGTPHVRTFGQTDLYISLLAFERDGSGGSIKAYVIPMVPWIWWSLPILMLGSVISVFPRRRRRAEIPQGVAMDIA